MSFEANLTTLARFSASLRSLPKTLGQRIATRAAPALTELAISTFRASEDAFGGPWTPAKDGGRVTLSRSGALARYIRYVAIGTKLRVALGVAYAKYQIGRRPIFPRQGDELPVSYRAALERAAKEVLTSELAGGGPR